MTATHSRMTSPQRLCPTCGELMVSSRCPECAPSEPARSYSERVTQPISSTAGAIAAANAVDVRRSTGEWVTSPEVREPSTRRAHPTLVRTALAEAEERAKEKVARSALVQRVHATTKPRLGSTSTSPRLRPVTPLPPPPDEDWSDASDDTASARPSEVTESAPVQVSAAVRIESPPQSPASPPQQATADEAPRGMIEPLAASPSLAVRPEPDELDDPAPLNRKAQLFWFALLGGVGVLLAVAVL